MELATAGEALKAGLRHALFAEILAGDAVANLDGTAERLADERADLGARTEESRRTLAIGRIQRAETRLLTARQHKAKVRKLLWPDDPEASDG